MEEQPIKLPVIIATKLAQFERRRKLVFFLRGLAESLLLLALGTLFLSLMEWVFRPALPWRVWLSGANYLLAAIWLLYRAAVPLLRRPSLCQTARAFETAAQDRFHERILSAVEMAESHSSAKQPGVSEWMVSKTISLAAEEIKSINPADLIDRRPAKRAWKWTSGILLVTALACFIPGFMLRVRLALDPYDSTAPFSTIKLSVAPGNCRLKQGTPLEIQVRAVPLPDQAKVSIQWDDGFRESVPMSRNGTNGFVLAIPVVSQAFRYAVEAEDAESALFSVEIDVPPHISRIQTLVQPPDYTQQTNRLVEAGSADFLLGSRVRLLVQSAGDKIASAEWLPDGLPGRRFIVDKDLLTLDLQPTNSVSYQIRLIGQNKLQSDSVQKWLLRPVPDEPPIARLIAVGAESGISGMVQRDELLPLQAESNDDVGLQRVDLVVLNKDSEADLKPIYPGNNDFSVTTSGMREVKASLNYNLADLNVLAGDEVQFQLVATDLQGQTTRSEPVSFTVGSLDKAREAQLAARLKELVSATDAQIDYLQQTRVSWLSIGRNYREEDPNAQGPALTLLKSRLNEFGREIALVGNRLVAESETNNLPDCRFMYRLGTTISSWGSQQRAILLESCGRLDQAIGTNIFQTFSQGREFFSRALLDLEQYKRVLAVLQGAFETDVLATRCESAQGRYKRGLPILRGEKNVDARSNPSGPGLLVTFFEGLDLNGKVLEQKIANPRFDNYAPLNRREQWSCRYEGDLNLTNAGDWTLGCLADDGVRLFVDGKSILPANAWSSHAATQFKADLPLPAGWHRVAIEFFQGSSESKLQFLAAKKGQPLQEIPVQWLRPPVARQPRPDLATNAALSSIVQNALKDRVKLSLSSPASVPPVLGPMTNFVQNDNLARIVRDKGPLGESLTSNLLTFASWKPEDAQKAEAQADDLTVLSKDAQRILREELEKYRWRYEGSAALKEVQNAIQELREINNELRQLPRHGKNKRTEQEQAKIALAQAWEKELQRAADEASHNFFETAKQKDATLAERTAALNATTKAEKELQPLLDKLGKILASDSNKEAMAGQMDQRLNEISERYRELNDLQENINREHVAAEARKALPAARAFDRAQRVQTTTDLSEKYRRMKSSVAEVQKAQRVSGDYSGAEKLASFTGNSPDTAKGTETADEIRGLAMRTDNNPPSLAQTIPPPLNRQTQALEKEKSTAKESANTLAKPRLAMTLEASRLNKQGDRKTAVAYNLLGQDLGELLESQDKLSASTLRPIARRAAALAGERGEEAWQAEIKAANERLQQLAQTKPGNQEALAAQLDELSTMSMQAANDGAKQQPLGNRLGEVAHLAPPVANRTDSTDAQEIAASAANESLSGIQAAPKQWESYHQASEILADAARQIRIDAAVSDLAELNPYPAPDTMPSRDSDSLASAASQERTASLERPDGKALTQAPPKGLDQAEWARLNERLRQAIRSSGIENFSEEQQAAIRAYFERLSSEK